MMKSATLCAAILAAACSRDARGTEAPKPASSTVSLKTHRSANVIQSSEFVDPGAAQKTPVREAIAVLRPTSDSNVSGIVRFVEIQGRGVHVYAMVDGLPGGPHAYHVHVYGDCSGADGKTAGPHFSFITSSFDKDVDFITGNLGELWATGNGSITTHDRRVLDASLHGEYSLLGRAVVVHERGNDFSVTPDGDAGARLACGVIGVANPDTPRTAAQGGPY
jgi:Cu-Zn family superoxide dismutase